MIRKAVLTLAMLVLTASSAWAVNPELGLNSFGVFFEQTADTNCNTSATPYSTLTAYVIACNLTRPNGLSAIEFTLLVNPTTFSAGISFDGGGGFINALTPPVFFCGISPSRNGQAVTIITISTFYLGGPIYFGLGPSVPSSFASLYPGYADADDPGILVPLHPCSQVAWTLPIYKGSNTDERLPANGPPNSLLVAAVNATDPACPPFGVSATQQSSWGSVKNLYR